MQVQANKLRFKQVFRLTYLGQSHRTDTSAYLVRTVAGKPTILPNSRPVSRGLSCGHLLRTFGQWQIDA